MVSKPTHAYPDDAPLPLAMVRSPTILKPFVVLDRRRTVITAFLSRDLADRYAKNWSRMNGKPSAVVFVPMPSIVSQINVAPSLGKPAPKSPKGRAV